MLFALLESSESDEEFSVMSEARTLHLELVVLIVIQNVGGCRGR